MKRYRVLLADDHALVAEGLRKLLEKEYDLAAVAADGRELLRKAVQLRPDAVVLDIAMPLLNGIEAAAQLRELLPQTRIVFATQHAERQYVQAAFRAGAHGYVVKQAAAAELLEALSMVLRGRYYVTPLVTKDLPLGPINPNVNPAELFGGTLRPRQREVLQLIAEGKSTKEMASVLNVSPKTIEYHKAAIMDELGLRTTAELTRYALEIGVISQ